jgi:hypothetical protein
VREVLIDQGRPERAGGDGGCAVHAPLTAASPRTLGLHRGFFCPRANAWEILHYVVASGWCEQAAVFVAMRYFTMIRCASPLLAGKASAFALHDTGRAHPLLVRRHWRKFALALRTTGARHEQGSSEGCG